MLVLRTVTGNVNGSKDFLFTPLTAVSAKPRLFGVQFKARNLAYLWLYQE